MSVSLGCTENDDDDAEKNDGNDHDEVTDTDLTRICTENDDDPTTTDTVLTQYPTTTVFVTSASDHS